MSLTESKLLKERDGVVESRQKRKPKGIATPVELIAEEVLCPWSALEAWLQESAPFRGDILRLFAKPGGDFYSKRSPEKAKRRAADQFRNLGYTVTLEPTAA